ncbi:hypothetical protein F8M41_021736 [Gigaspora margarita]|uniref:Uncharacterized protein n=1 Tax=Gigaspora margarita TaxID=4874 RepID=A0A8H4AGA3_GIGMA|nr:hypothetical protein F8M41_021736 [Gigaspora margarita]
MQFSKINSILALCLLFCSIFVAGAVNTHLSADAHTVNPTDSNTKEKPSHSDTATPTGTDVPTGSGVPVITGTTPTPTGTGTSPYPAWTGSHASSSAAASYTPAASPTPAIGAGNTLRSVAVDNLIYIGLFVCSAAFYLNF